VRDKKESAFPSFAHSYMGKIKEDGFSTIPLLFRFRQDSKHACSALRTLALQRGTRASSLCPHLNILLVLHFSFCFALYAPSRGCHREKMY